MLQTSGDHLCLVFLFLIILLVRTSKRALQHKWGDLFLKQTLNDEDDCSTPLQKEEVKKKKAEYWKQSPGSNGRWSQPWSLYPAPCWSTASSWRTPGRSVKAPHLHFLPAEILHKESIGRNSLGRRDGLVFLPSLTCLAFLIQSVRWRTKSKKKSPSGTLMTWKDGQKNKNHSAGFDVYVRECVAQTFVQIVS